MLAADEIERLRCDLFMKNWRIEELADHIEELQEEINDLRLQVVTLSIPKEDHRG
jgi:ribosomal protein L29